MNERVAPQLTEDEALAVMAKGLHAHIHLNGPDLEADHLAIPCDALPLETRRAMWAQARKEKATLAPKSAEVRPFVRRIGAKAAPRPAQIVSRTGRIVSNWESLSIPAGANKLERLTYVPGVVGEMVDWMVHTAKRPNRMMALSTALCVVGTLIGRHVRGPTGSGTHLYIVILAPSGYGKDHPLWCGKTTMKAVNASHLIGPDEFASSPGFTKRLAENPLLICFVDEFGDELDKIKTQGNNAFVKNVVGLLKKCYNAWETANTAAKAHEPSIEILWPAPSMVAAATPERFFGTLTPEDFESGFINRFLILPFESFRRPPEQLVLATDPPKEIIAALNALPRADNTILERKIEAINKPILVEVGWADPSVAELYLKFSRKMDFAESGERRRYELGMRATEHAIRLATDVAVGRGLLVVELADMAWAIALAEESFEAAVGGAEKYMHEYLEFPRMCDRVAEAYRVAGFISERDANRKFGRNQRWGNEFEKVQNQLRKEGRIHYTTRAAPNGGPEAKGYEWID
jgi:hypothetical protein